MKLAKTENNKLPFECMSAQAEASCFLGVKMRFRIHLISFAACALLPVLVLGFVFQASGLNMWRLFVSWDNEIMEMREEKTDGK